MAQLPMIDVDPKFVLEVASGIVPPSDLAEKYGYTPEQWIFLKEYDPFVKQVEAKKAELKASGYTFKMKAAVAAEDLLEDVYLKAKAEDSSFHTQLEALKFMARAAGIDAPVKEVAQQGPGFSITINIGNGQSVQIGQTQTGQQSQTRTPEEIDAEYYNTIEHDPTAGYPAEEYDFSMAFQPFEAEPLNLGPQ